MFIVTFIRVFAEFFRVVVVIPRWDHRLKDPESVAFAILDVLADFESEGKLKNLPKSKKFPVKTILAILLFKQYYNLPLRDAQHYGRKFFGAKHSLLNPPQLGEKAEPRRTDKPPPEKTPEITLRQHSSRLNHYYK
ncbi:hypothetical protein [Thermococcus sp. PK]|uniref:hypothetical protein n=1 Tax=Thermococcus sp. PK TaxID=913025 RepID=UPI0012EC8E45|nr:hypothetical protein [Thermococcus sp. PK]